VARRFERRLHTRIMKGKQKGQMRSGPQQELWASRGILPLGRGTSAWI
jgi:hypothetical protein